MKRKIAHIIFLLTAMIACVFMTSCIEDGISTSPSDRLDFSVDTLDIGVVYTDELTVTSRFTVYNRNGKGLNISDIHLAGEGSEYFRINVDGLSGDGFRDIEIRANDSIFVFVEACLPPNNTEEAQQVQANLQFTTNGMVDNVILKATGQDIVRLNGLVVDADMVLDSRKPYRVIDSLVVEENVTLTIDSGVKVLFHDKANMLVKGTLRILGTPEAPVKLTGDRTGEVLPGVSFDIMSRQWGGIEFLESSMGNEIQYAEISNTCYGVIAYGIDSDVEAKKLKIVNSRLRNSGEFASAAINASVEARGCEFAEAADGLVYLLGGDNRFDRCTFANNYLFTAISGAAIAFADPAQTEEYAESPKTKALFANSIIYGIGTEVAPGDLDGWDVVFARCLFKSNGEDDANFVNSLWDCDPLFYTVREEYYFDYRLKKDSPAIDAADQAFMDVELPTDYYGLPRAMELGAYAFDSALSDE